MRRSMKPSKETEDRSLTRGSERRAQPEAHMAGERRVADKRGIGAAMVDALEDILAWERASERTMKAADIASDLN